jgi:hypothetical protein
MMPKSVSDFIRKYGSSVTVKRRVAGSTTEFQQYGTKAALRIVTTSRREDELANGTVQEQSNVVFPGDDIPDTFGAGDNGPRWPDIGDMLVTPKGTFSITSSNPIFVGDQLYRVDCHLVG